MTKKSNANMLAVIRHLALKNIQIKTGSRCEHNDRAGYSASSHLDLSNTDLIEARLQCAVDAVYNPHLRTFLHGIARRALHRLDGAHPAYGGLLRLCMGWGNPDEESEFAVELQQRIAYAVETLDLANF